MCRKFRLAKDDGFVVVGYNLFNGESRREGPRRCFTSQRIIRTFGIAISGFVFSHEYTGLHGDGWGWGWNGGGLLLKNTFKDSINFRIMQRRVSSGIDGSRSGAVLAFRDGRQVSRSVEARHCRRQRVRRCCRSGRCCCCRTCVQEVVVISEEIVGILDILKREPNCFIEINDKRIYISNLESIHQTLISSFFRFSLISLAILKYRQYFCMLQTLNHNNKKWKKSSFYKEKSLVW